MSEVVNDNVAEISTGVPVKQGDRVLVAIVDGEPTVISAEGAGDELGAKIEQAFNRIGSISAAVAENAKAAADAKQGVADAMEIANASGNAAAEAQADAATAKSSAAQAVTDAQTAGKAASLAQSAAAAAQSAADAAKAQANATASHFWMDAAGQANVSTDDGTVETGHSVTIGSKGIIQRLDGKLMQSLTNTALNFYLAQSGAPLLAAAYTPDGMGVYAAGKQLSSFTGSGAVFYDGASDSPTEQNVNASFGSDGAVIGKQSGMHAALSASEFDIRSGSAGVFAAGILRTTCITDMLVTNPSAGASFTLSHVPVAAPSVYLRYYDVSAGTITDMALSAGTDYTVDGRTVALSSSWAAPDYTDNVGILYADYSYASDAPEVSIGDGNVRMTYSAPNEPDFIGMNGESGMEWTLTNQGNVRCRRTSDGGTSWTAWEYFSKEGHKHSVSDIRRWRYSLWKAKTVSKNYTIKANSNATVEITTKPDSGYSYAAVMRIFTQHQTAVKVSGWNVNSDSVSVDLSNHGNSSSISSSTLTVQLLELKN